MNEVQAIIAIGGGTIIMNGVVTGISWFISSRRQSRKEGFYNGVMKEQVDNLEQRVDCLPCIADPHYEHNAGALAQKVENVTQECVQMKEAINSLEKAINGGKK